MSTVISSDQAHPTVFENERLRILPKGMMVLNLMDYTEVEMPMNVTATVRAQARGHLTDTVFMGGFLASINYAELGRDLTLEGVFELQLA